MQNIYFYPKLTDKLLENCGCSVTKYVFTYSYQGQDFGLLQKGSSTVICTPFTGHPVGGVLLCGTRMSTKGNV